MNLLPFDQLDDKQFESFLLKFLGAGISLEVTERRLPREGSTEAAAATARYRIVRVSLVGSKTQFGADVRAFTEGGAEWIFQCKHYPDAPFTTTLAKKALDKANREYPQASRCFLVLAFPPVSPEVAHTVEADPKWQVWEPSELSTRFLNEVPRGRQIEIIRRSFPKRADQLIAQLFPQQDELLISSTAFFARSSPINFGTAFVGRETELAQLLAFAQSPGPVATILSAAGGIGKTRLLRAFAEQLAAQAPDVRVLFLNPDANPQANTDALRAATDGNLVVVIDDAHRREVLRGDVARTVAEKKGRLLLSARPQAIEALRVWLTNHGFPAAQTAEPIRLRPLTVPQLQMLAAAELGPDLVSRASRIVELADGNALLVTVAAGLLRDQSGTSVESLLASDGFGQRILDHLVDKTLEAAFVAGDPRDRARDVLHVLAALAPWTEEVLSLDRMANILDCSPREFNRLRDELLRTKLLVRTGRGLRVVPDLLADHLVRRACFEPGSDTRLTSVAEAIQKKFAPAISCTSGLHVIRNLAEAEAQQGDADGKLVEPFWQTFLRQFEAASFAIRANLLHEWANFAVFQPTRSLALAQFAIETIDAPPSPASATDDIVERLLPATQARVLARLAELLEPLAAHCPKHSEAALNLLWALDKQTANSVAPGTSAALDALGLIADWENHRHLDAVQALIAWLDGQLYSGAGAERLCQRRSPALSVLLKPVFECTYDWIESDPGSSEARLVALPGSDTEPLYTATLNLIERQVLPAGEVAILNIHGVLESALAASPHHGRLRALPESLRVRTLKLVAALLANQPSPRVLFRIRETLRGILKREPTGTFRDEVQSALDSIPDSADLRLTIVLRSNRWTEFFHYHPLEEQQSSLGTDLYQTQWLQLTDTVARNLAIQFTTGPSLFGELERIGGEFLSVGETPDFAELLAALCRIVPPLALDVFDSALGKPHTTFDRSLFSLVPPPAHCADSTPQRLVERILHTPNPERWSALLIWLGWLGADRITPELLTYIAAWSAQLDDEGLRAVLPHLSLRSAPASSVGETILEHLPLAHLPEASIAALCQRLGELRRETDRFSLPSGFRARFIAELHRVERFELRISPSCLPVLAQEEPRQFLEMLQRRVRDAAERKNPYPLGYREFLPLDKLVNESDYPDLARALLSEVRHSDRESARHWATLFQWAVLTVSPLGLTLLDEWLRETRDADELARLIRCLRFDGSMVVFEHPDFVRRIVERARMIAPAKLDDLRAALANTGSPTTWGLINGEPNPETRRYRDEAAKAAAVHASVAELAAFYREIMRQEDTHAAFLHRSYEPDDEWSY